jgi:hypothetical protein
MALASRPTANPDGQRSRAPHPGGFFGAVWVLAGLEPLWVAQMPARAVPYRSSVIDCPTFAQSRLVSRRYI